MSTHSSIGVRLLDGSVKGVYCHADGYYSGVGKKLLEHYSDINKVLALIDLGSIVGLGTQVGVKHDYFMKTTDTTYFGRDREEDDVDCKTFANQKEFINFYHFTYNYLFKNNKWYVYDFEKGKFTLLTKAMIASDL